MPRMVLEGRHIGAPEDARVGRGPLHEEIEQKGAQVNAYEHCVRAQHGIFPSVGHDGAGDRSAEDGHQGEEFDHAVGPYEAFSGKDLGQDSILGGPVDAGADANHEVSDALPDRSPAEAQCAEECTQYFQGIAAGQPGGFGVSVIEETRDWGQENEGNEQQAGVDGVVGPELGVG